MFIKKLIGLAAITCLFASAAMAAIDTANRRAIACGDKEPIPDATIDAGDRAQMVGEYRAFFDSGSASTGATLSNAVFNFLRREEK